MRRTSTTALILSATVALAAGCDGRPDIDPAPYYQPCTSPPDTCPSPYQCVTPSTLLPPTSDVCFAPCEHDDDCPEGFLCNGDTTSVADLGPPEGYCFRDGDG
ncbi:MAG: hypothetical protein H6708_07735 [Kofleriaceae bacterium]|nr:hypothetical protein [Kofleriaceae bacterium]